MSESLHRRARDIKARALVRSFEYRQRNQAGGVWFRLRRILVDARQAWTIPEQEAARLLAEGLRPEAVGAELEPPKAILFVPLERLQAVPDRVELPLRLGPELLAARWIALVRFESLDPP